MTERISADATAVLSRHLCIPFLRIFFEACSPWRASIIDINAESILLPQIDSAQVFGNGLDVV